MSLEVERTKISMVPEIVQRVLAGRGMSKPQMLEFLNPHYEDGLWDPYLLTDMALAVDRIARAARDKESVMVYGDYDIDGITASCVMLEVLQAIGIVARSYIPDRFEEGYGINQDALEQIKGDGTKLVISVDCGITSVKEALWAREHNLDLIITDHHAVPEIIPQAVAVINPKRPGDQYPFKDLAGVGVAFKLACALQTRLGKPAAGQEKWWLDMVALGTVCDVVPLVGENRVLASFGLKVLRQTRRLGLRELAAVGGVDLGRVRAYHLGYVLGPRMNAAGRIKHATRSVELLRTGDTSRARTLAEELDELNRQRRKDQDAIFTQAEVMANEFSGDPVLVVASTEWSHGVVGIVASKLVDKLHKPVLVAQILPDSTKGSARSVAGFNMVEALRANRQLLTKFGGHYFAAGCTFPNENLESLRVGLCQYYVAAESGLVEEATAQIDIQMADLASADLDLLDALDQMEPFGSSNPQPLVAISDLTIESLSKVGSDLKHLRFVFVDGGRRRLTGIGFGLVAKYPSLREGQKVTALGELNKNEWRGAVTPQIVVRELHYD
ncbi:MAG TPA: single-stranded-DNA-specific exonuclease RecJ [Candidatus Saccharimonadia bacterium]|nr:single-stranded-DNA-specific exonuclease RecJ [Candidatus Saccharimonadia bacterium]